MRRFKGHLGQNFQPRIKIQNFLNIDSSVENRSNYNSNSKDKCDPFISKNYVKKKYSVKPRRRKSRPFLKTTSSTSNFLISSLLKRKSGAEETGGLPIVRRFQKVSGKENMHRSNQKNESRVLRHKRSKSSPKSQPKILCGDTYDIKATSQKHKESKIKNILQVDLLLNKSPYLKKTGAFFDARRWNKRKAEAQPLVCPRIKQRKNMKLVRKRSEEKHPRFQYKKAGGLRAKPKGCSFSILNYSFKHVKNANTSYRWEILKKEQI